MIWSAKRALRCFAYASGVLGLMHQLRNRRTLTVFMFHRVLPADSGAYSFSEREFSFTVDGFRQTLDFICRHYNVVSHEAIRANVEHNVPLPDRAGLITFDDGWRDTLIYAFPELKKRNLPAVLFLSDEDDVLEKRELCARESAALGRLELWDELVHHRDVVAVAVAVGERQRRDVGLREEIIRLVALVRGVDGDQHHADLRRREDEGVPVGDVRRPDAEVIAFLEADRKKPLREIVAAFVELPVGEAQIAVGVDEKLLVGIPRDLVLENLPHCLCEKFH